MGPLHFHVSFYSILQGVDFRTVSLLLWDVDAEAAEAVGAH